MLLNYLYANFQEESLFAQTCNLSIDELNAFIGQRLCPKASYIYNSCGTSISFVGECQQNRSYRFYLRGHMSWLQSIKRMGLETEERARGHFEARYNEAMARFCTSRLGTQLCEMAPSVTKKFSAEMKAATWQHFLNGVYGVCTRDGQPETIFLKQVGVMFIDEITERGPTAISETSLALLAQTVAFLDRVESDFAPGEVANTSRQRCIIDVRADFLTPLVA